MVKSIDELNDESVTAASVLALARLLEKKGIITSEEYKEEIQSILVEIED